MFDIYGTLVTIEVLAEMFSIGKNRARKPLKCFFQNRIWTIPKGRNIQYICEQSYLL